MLITRISARRRSRRGMSILVVLTLIAVTMAVSYAALRTQSVEMSIQSNASSMGDAAQAARSALRIGLRRMHDSDWSGVDAPLAGQLSTTERYAVQYYTGITDADGNSLHPPQEDAAARAEWPFCVTLVCTGFAENPSSGSESSHRIRAVVRLSEPKLNAAVSGWDQILPYTVYQWKDDPAELELPLHVAGKMYAQGEIELAEDYPARSRKPFDGLIDEVAIFDKALSETEIATIYAMSSSWLKTLYALHGAVAWWSLDEPSGSTVAADSAGSNSGTYEGASPGIGVTQLGLGNKAARFDGVNDHVNLGRPDVGGSAMTILAWFRADSFNVSDARIISKAVGTADQDHYWMLSTISDGGDIHLRFRLKAGGTTTVLIADEGDLSTGAWVFAACVYDGAAMKIYKNGELVGQTPKSGTIATNSDVFAFLGDNPPGSARARYLRDLNAMRLAGSADHRPFGDELDYASTRTEAATRALIEGDLQTPTTTVAEQDTEPFSQPGAPSTYQLYPGGRTYTVPSLEWSLTAEQLESDLDTNPLGIQRRSGSLSVYDDVKVRGTLIVEGPGSTPDLHVYGANFSLSAVDIPKLDGSGGMIQLPAAIVENDIRVHSTGDGSAQGALLAWDSFRIHSGSETAQFALAGKLACGELQIQKRDEWEQDDDWWEARLFEFLDQRYDQGGTSPVEHFPSWLASEHPEFAVEPRFRFTPDSANPDYHFPDFAQPLFGPQTTGDGLLWDILEIDDGV